MPLAAQTFRTAWAITRLLDNWRAQVERETRDYLAPDERLGLTEFAHEVRATARQLERLGVPVPERGDGA